MEKVKELKEQRLLAVDQRGAEAVQRIGGQPAGC